MLQHVVEEIYGSGLSEPEIARQCGTSQPTIHRIRTGKTTDTFSKLADRIKALHAERKGLGLIPEKAA